MAITKTAAEIEELKARADELTESEEDDAALELYFILEQALDPAQDSETGDLAHPDMEISLEIPDDLVEKFKSL